MNRRGLDSLTVPIQHVGSGNDEAEVRSSQRGCLVGSAGWKQQDLASSAFFLMRLTSSCSFTTRYAIFLPIDLPGMLHLIDLCLLSFAWSY